MKELLSKITEKVLLAREEQIIREQVFFNEKPKRRKNDFLFFIKPEILLLEDRTAQMKIIELIIDRISAIGLFINEVNVLSAFYLKKYNIITQHYGVINRISDDVKKNISETAKEKFYSVYNTPFDQAEVFGSLEFLREFPEFTPLTLDYLWQNKKFEKLAGGTYVLDLTFNGRKVFLINGFHPRQLDHFTRSGRCIVTFTLSGDLSWKEARNHFIGITDPARAEEGSLRRYFYDNASQLGLPAISASWNGVHLSAGPVEALVELIRYNSDFSSGKTKQAGDYAFGKELISAFGEKQMENILSNINMMVDGKNISVFDLTEEKDSDEALAIIKKYYG